MTAVFMHGDDVEWTLLDGDGEVAQVGETTTTEETLSQQQQHVEELRAALDRKEAELMRTREELRVARIDIAVLAMSVLIVLAANVSSRKSANSESGAFIR